MKSTRRGFTLIELLTVIAIVGLLAAILVPTVNRAREAARRSKCMSNVRQITMGLINIASQNRKQEFPTSSLGNWAWDISHSVINEIAKNAGREAFYCPSNPMWASFGIDRAYTYGGDPVTSQNTFAVTSYVMLIPGNVQIPTTWLNYRIQDTYMNNTVSVSAAQRMLVVDAVVSKSTSSNYDSFNNISAGLPVNSSNHMDGGMPSGAHAGYVDGHVKWRAYKTSTLADPSGFATRGGASGGIYFWF